MNMGPYLSYLLKHTVKIKVDNGYKDVTDNTENDKRIDLGAVLGAGVKSPLNKRYKFIVELRENLGLINVSAVEVANNGSIKTNNLSFLVGISFRPGH